LALEKRVGKLEINYATSAWIERAAWLVVGALVVMFIGK